MCRIYIYKNVQVEIIIFTYIMKDKIMHIIYTVPD
jgi:hypothetical protein